jgi:hypothetical protein
MILTISFRICRDRVSCLEAEENTITEFVNNNTSSHLYGISA